jgi:hypothetical protein
MTQFIIKLLAQLALKEIIEGLLQRVNWQIIAERFITATVILGLKKLRDMSSNQLLDDTVTDIIRMLQGRGLSRADEQQLPSKSEG